MEKTRQIAIRQEDYDFLEKLAEQDDRTLIATFHNIIAQVQKTR